jgi:PAS domain S-box-containing protein
MATNHHISDLFQMERSWSDILTSLQQQPTSSSSSSSAHPHREMIITARRRITEQEHSSSYTQNMIQHLHIHMLDACTCCGVTYVVIHVRPFPHEILNASFDPMFYIDQSGTIEYANTAVTDLLGYTSGELIGQNISMLCGGGHDASHPAYMQRYLETGEHKVIGKQRHVLARAKDGREMPILLGVREIPTHHDPSQRHYCGFIKDMSVLEAHERQLEQKTEILQAMVDASFDPMFEINDQGIIQVANQAAASMFGYEISELVGTNIHRLCGGEHGAYHDSYMHRYMQTREKRIINRKRRVFAKRKDGSEFEVELGVREVVCHDGSSIFCGYMRDITQQQLDKLALRKHKEMIHGKFFGEPVQDDASASDANSPGKKLHFS